MPEGQSGGADRQWTSERAEFSSPPRRRGYFSPRSPYPRSALSKAQCSFTTCTMRRLASSGSVGHASISRASSPSSGAVSKSNASEFAPPAPATLPTFLATHRLTSIDSSPAPATMHDQRHYLRLIDRASPLSPLSINGNEVFLCPLLSDSKMKGASALCLYCVVISLGCSNAPAEFPSVFSESQDQVVTVTVDLSDQILRLTPFMLQSDNRIRIPTCRYSQRFHNDGLGGRMEANGPTNTTITKYERRVEGPNKTQLRLPKYSRIRKFYFLVAVPKQVPRPDTRRTGETKMTIFEPTGLLKVDPQEIIRTRFMKVPRLNELEENAKESPELFAELLAQYQARRLEQERLGKIPVGQESTIEW
jgi:hypothetical protein